MLEKEVQVFTTEACESGARASPAFSPSSPIAIDEEENEISVDGNETKP